MVKKVLFIMLLLFISGCAVKQPYVSITFDDGWASIYENGFPILERYKFPATLFVLTGSIGTNGYMDWEQINVLSKLGKWEIASHTHTHPDLRTIKPDEVEYELKHSKGILMSRGFKPVGFAAPHGSYNDEVLSLIKKHYSYHRKAWGGAEGFNDIENFDSYTISSIEIHHDKSFEEKKWIIDKAITENRYLVLLMHKVVKGQAKDYEIGAENLVKLLDYLKSKNVRVVTIADFLKENKLLR